MSNDKPILRDLVKRYLDIARSPQQAERRDAWRRHNSFQGNRPLIYLRSIPFGEFFDEQTLRCRDSFLRGYERMLHLNFYRARVRDDYIIEPWLTVNARLIANPAGNWGFPEALGEKPRPHGAAAYRPSIIGEDDVKKMRVYPHRVDEEATARDYGKLHDCVGDLIDIAVDRKGALCGIWNSDICTSLAKLRGLEQIMWDAYDRPEWFHSLLAFMRDSILQNHRQTERAGDFRLIDHQNQAMPYALELPDPSASDRSVPMKQLWGYMAAQEFTTFGPVQFDEFMLSYQIPILEQFGLSAYGCCEDLTRKIPLLRRIKNLRRIAVTPFADAGSCAEQIGRDYILSWRPNPSHVSYGHDEEFIRGLLREHFDIFKANGNLFDITIKDVETVGGDAGLLIRWVDITREEIDRAFG